MRHAHRRTLIPNTAEKGACLPAVEIAAQVKLSAGNTCNGRASRCKDGSQVGSAGQQLDTMMSGRGRDHRYGTILCDLKQGRVVDLLPTGAAKRWRPGFVSTRA
jgi:hypothetical protein